MLFWLIPPLPPIKAEIRANGIKIFILKKIDERNKGAIFCQVVMISKIFHLIFLVTWGNQKWRGANPSFKNNEIRIILEKKEKLVEEKFKFSTIKKVINRTDAKACTKKYLIAASIYLKLALIIIRGMNLIILISNPNQEINHELEEIESREPEINRKKNKL